MKIAKIGMRGIPAKFDLCSGWDTVVQELSTRLAQDNHQVVVFNRWYIGRDKQPKIKEHQGVKLIWIPTFLSKRFGAFFYSFLSSIRVLFTDVEIVHYYTAGLSIFGALPRLFGKKVVCSVDGLDWQRAKWGGLAKRYIKASEKIAILISNEIVTDAKVIQDYYLKTYGKSTSCIVYGAPILKMKASDWLRKFALEPRKYILFVGRLTPENNVHHLIEAFRKVRTHFKLVIVGDDPYHQDYVNSLKSTNDPRIIFTGYVYGKGYKELNCNAYLFVFPDQVGGTHPALIEAMGCGNCVLVNNTAANLEVIDKAGLSYNGKLGSEDLYQKLQKLVNEPELVAKYRQKAVQRIHQFYQWDRAAQEHKKLYLKLLHKQE
jgi:glycosyltransferase involved in cell wall biosynthesis